MVEILLRSQQDRGTIKTVETPLPNKRNQDTGKRVELPLRLYPEGEVGRTCQHCRRISRLNLHLSAVQLRRTLTLRGMMSLAAQSEAHQQVHSCLLSRRSEMVATLIWLLTHYQESMAAHPRSLVHRSAKGNQPWVDRCNRRRQATIGVVGAWTAERDPEEIQQNDQLGLSSLVMIVARAAQNGQLRVLIAMTALIVATTRDSHQLNQQGRCTPAAI